LRQKAIFQGDRQVGGEQRDIVVCSTMDDGVYTDRYTASDWAYLAAGVRVEFENGLLVHYDEQDMEPEVELLARK
jgi:hypothetical protein